MDKNTGIDDLLRKCVVIATKLQLEDLLRWAKKELNGYEQGDEVPRYRTVPVEVKAYNPYQGAWLPFLWEQEPPEELRKRKLYQSVAQLNDLVSKHDGVLAMNLPNQVARKLMDAAETVQPPVFIVSKTSVRGVLDTLRNVILDWSLKLEAEGILGKGMTFTNEEKSSALKSAGKWALDFFKSVGTEVASAAIKKSAGIE